LATAAVALGVGELMTGPIAWKPAVGAFAYGVVSGGLFITAMLVLGIFPFQVYITAGWVQVLLSTLSSIIICMILYLPAKALYERAG
jgi:ABC-type antimicrobial peptide transport system permease subunit